jgi:neutral ceramidase
MSLTRRWWAEFLPIAPSLLFVFAVNSTAEPRPLRVGAARVDITPPLLPMINGMPETLVSHLYVRAIVLDNGETRAALINADQGHLSDQIWSSASQGIAELLHCPVANVILSATHVHSDGANYHRGYAQATAPPDTNFPSVADAAVQAVREAYAHLQPAKVGFATQNVYLNVNRDALSPITHRWYQGPNLQAPSDKTLAVITFETPGGKPIAIYFNYAMHPIDYYLTGIVSADFPGTAAADLESLFPGAVAIFTQGASGDQNPLYLEPHLDMHNAINGEPERNVTVAQAAGMGGVVGVVPGEPQSPEPYQLQAEQFPAVPATWVPSREPEMQKAAANLNAWVAAEGEVISQATLRAIRHTDFFSSNVDIEGAQTVLTCPGRTRTNAKAGWQSVPGTYEDGPPVPIRLGLLRIGPIAIGTADAELFTQIAQRLKSESPLKDTMMVTLTNGRAPSGYIPNDEAFTQETFQVLGTHLKPGCAENGIVNGILGLMPASLR